MKTPDPEKVFRSINRRYFSNRLPNPPEVIVRFGKMEKMLGYQQGDEIVLNQKFREFSSVWIFTLYHEMVHMSLPRKIVHGARFQKEMYRLSRAGAFESVW